jgi:hypothetical protein
VSRSLRIAWAIDALAALGLVWFSLGNPLPPGFADTRPIDEM